METRVVDLAVEGLANHSAKDSVLIDRSSAWLNPYQITDELPRDESLGRYRHYMLNEITKGRVTIRQLLGLRGKKLIGYGEDEIAHGQTLVDLVEWAYASTVNLMGRLDTDIRPPSFDLEGDKNE